MSNIDKRALSEIAEAAVGAHERLSVMPADDIFDISLAEGTPLGDADITALNALNFAANPTTVLALLDELEAKDMRIAELSALQGKPIAWESTTPVYVKFITDERYQRLRPGYKKWYKPYRCSQCAAAGKGE